MMKRHERKITWRLAARAGRPSLSAAQLAGALFAATASSTPACAQQAADAQDIVVTANRRETKLLDTPMSVTVVSSKTLDAINANDFADFARLVPGLSYTDSGPGNKRYALRGLQSAGEPEVALYYDEIPVSGVPGGSLDTGDSQPDIKLWDVDRVEVLRGPQGTLYGNGSMGGAIRIISKRPVLDKFEAAARASTGVTDGGDPSWGLSGMLNVPVVSDVIGVRLTGYYRHEGGWIDDVRRDDIAIPQIGRDNINSERTYGGRGSVSVQPSASWNITGIAYYQDTKTSAFDLYPAFATATDPYVSKSYVREPWRDKILMTNLISTYNFGFAELTATGSYQRRTLDRTVDTTRFLVISAYGCTELNYDKTCFTPDTIPAGGYSNEQVEAWSGEARLASKTPGPIQWTIGASFQNSETSRRSQVAQADTAGLIEVDPASGDALHRIFERDNHDTFDQYAFFGEASYDLTRALTATVGYRWFHSDRTDQQVLVQQFFPGAPTGAQPFQEFKEGKLFQKYELSYKFGDKGLLYVQAAQGFRAGGPNFPGGFAISAPPYQADSVWDYELGWKLNLLDKRVYWTGAVFHIDWSNLQQLIPTQMFNYIANVGKARSDGFESELVVDPAKGLSLGAGLTYNNARLVGRQPVQTNPALQLYAGDKLANVPDWTANWNATYIYDLSNGYESSLRLDGSYQSGRADLVASANPAYFRIGSSTLVGLHAALDSHRSWRLGIDASNLLNTYAPISARALDSNLAKTVVAARPRTVTLTLNVRY
jgi:iron complex outermembrane receptor protein